MATQKQIEAAAEEEPTIPAQIVVGSARFRKGVKVSTVQNAITRLAERYRKVDTALWLIRVSRDKTAEQLRKIADDALCL